MELKNFAKKAAVVALVASFGVAALSACNRSSDTTTSTTTSDNGATKTKTVRSKSSTYMSK